MFRRIIQNIITSNFSFDKLAFCLYYHTGILEKLIFVYKKKVSE